MAFVILFSVFQLGAFYYIHVGYIYTFMVYILRGLDKVHQSF